MHRSIPDHSERGSRPTGIYAAVVRDLRPAPPQFDCARAASSVAVLKFRQCGRFGNRSAIQLERRAELRSRRCTRRRIARTHTAQLPNVGRARGAEGLTGLKPESTAPSHWMDVPVGLLGFVAYMSSQYFVPAERVYEPVPENVSRTATSLVPAVTLVDRSYRSVPGRPSPAVAAVRCRSQEGKVARASDGTGNQKG